MIDEYQFTKQNLSVQMSFYLLSCLSLTQVQEFTALAHRIEFRSFTGNSHRRRIRNISILKLIWSASTTEI